jgi:hypothetical protein
MTRWGSRTFKSAGGPPTVLSGDAAVGDVLDGKFFYADDARSRLEGTLALSGNAVVGDVTAGKTFYSSDAKTILTGTKDIYTVLLLHMDGANGGTTFTDEKGHTFTRRGGATTNTSQKKFGTASLLCDGTSDNIDCPNDATMFTMGANNFTIDFWLFPLTAETKILVGQYVDGNNYWYAYRQADAKIAFLYRSGATTLANYVTTTATVATNTFHHLAFVRNGTDFRIYIDGVSATLTASVAIGANSLTNINAPFCIGDYQSGGGALSMFAYMDEFRFVNGLAIWTSNFSVPTAPYA